ncbi:transposon Ty3-G Gag-Pol polyprotein [Trichonephila clavipes]|uniref:Transposon Ty3-G Gag-Pol polyprotein n=1 Tax=Trichonephila clavipes TaxID=2585209 RepID=A0A8X6RMR9_TRICX|nr:transposon Ty3-G Gag-Pol polyprotein [Trichonephila clavipes]
MRRKHRIFSLGYLRESRCHKSLRTNKKQTHKSFRGIVPAGDSETSFSWEDLGSRKSSELLHNMKWYMESLNVDDKLMELFLQRLSSLVQTILAAVSDLTINKAADIADIVSPSPIETFAVSNKKE